MNINKRGGLAHSNNTTLQEYAILYKERIRKEIDTLLPVYVICCNICFEILLNEIFNEEELREISCDSFRYNNALFIKWWHPNASKRISDLEEIMNRLNNRK